MSKITHDFFLNYFNLNPEDGGMLLIDKPKSWTSHDIVAKIRRLTDIKKIGHSGTLDPLATGLLIILVGKKFTKQQDSFLKLDKEYLCTAQFGIETDSYDIEGRIIHEMPWSSLQLLTQDKVEKAMSNLRGEILQKVPAFSAVKIDGKKLYNLARNNQMAKITLPEKKVKIHEFSLLSFNCLPDNESISVDFKISCGSGTYIRSLIHDLGQLLNTGATITALRRTKIDKYSVDNTIKMEDVLKMENEIKNKKVISQGI